MQCVKSLYNDEQYEKKTVRRSLENSYLFHHVSYEIQLIYDGIIAQNPSNEFFFHGTSVGPKSTLVTTRVITFGL